MEFAYNLKIHLQFPMDLDISKERPGRDEKREFNMARNRHSHFVQMCSLIYSFLFPTQPKA